MRSFKVEGIIIKRRNLGEADRIITVFSKTQGKIKIKAKGVRKISSRRGAHVELLNTSFLTLYDGGKMPILTEATTIKSFNSKKNGLRKVSMAFHICELIDGLCAEHQANQKIYLMLKEVLSSLEKTDNLESLITDFERELLLTLGFLSHTQSLTSENSQYLIESILERRLRSKRILASIT